MNQGFKVYRPVTKRIKTRANKKEQISKSLFPRYLFVRMQTGVDNWEPVRSTLGVAGILKFGAHPVKVQDSLIDEIRFREKAWSEQIIERNRFQKGQVVKVTQDPFNHEDSGLVPA